MLLVTEKVGGEAWEQASNNVMFLLYHPPPLQDKVPTLLE
jgi:hypothetical protein